MTPPGYQCIYLSPHLDDVVLSCGGTVHCDARRGHRSLVITIFAGWPPRGAPGPLARELEERWGQGRDPVAARRREDLVAVRRVGGEPVHLDFPDCVYRPDAAGRSLYPREEDIFGTVHPQEATYHLEILRGLWPYLKADPAALVISPLTIGRHVDHVIVQRAALHLAAGGRRVAFYEDHPYAADPEAAARELPPLQCGAWRREALLLEDVDLQAKQDAVAAYESQISTFWRSLQEMRDQVARTAMDVGNGRPAENRWRVASPGERLRRDAEGER